MESIDDEEFFVKIFLEMANYFYRIVIRLRKKLPISRESLQNKKGLCPTKILFGTAQEHFFK